LRRRRHPEGKQCSHGGRFTSGQTWFLAWQLLHLKTVRLDERWVKVCWSTAHGFFSVYTVGGLIYEKLLLVAGDCGNVILFCMSELMVCFFTLLFGSKETKMKMSGPMDRIPPKRSRKEQMYLLKAFLQVQN
jgi:hypothetical protein